MAGPAAAGMIFDFPVRVGTSGDTEFELDKIRFGGSYEQISKRVPDNAADEWDVQMERRPLSEVKAAEAFIRMHEGNLPFLWFPPNWDHPVHVRCERFRRTFTGHYVGSVSLTFIRDRR